MARVAVAEALQALADANQGKLTPEQVLEVARDPRHPLHSHFEWDDAAAGEAFRLGQARRLIRSVKVEFRTERTTVQTVAYIRDPSAAEHFQGYVSLPRLRREPDLAREALVAEFARAAAALRRARNLAAALGIQDEIDEIVSRVDGLRQATASTQAA